MKKIKYLVAILIFISCRSTLTTQKSTSLPNYTGMIIDCLITDNIDSLKYVSCEHCVVGYYDTVTIISPDPTK